MAVEHIEAVIGAPGFRALLERERARFGERTPASREIFEASQGSLFKGVPMPWMLEWPNPYPLYSGKAEGSRLWDADGNEYVDFCFGDTGSMFGHSPKPIVEAVRNHIADGITTMLPSPAGRSVGRSLADRFGLPYWQLALSATDANRFVLRLARAITGRPLVLVYHGCYHGSLDETLVELDAGGETVKRALVDPNPGIEATASSVVVEFNDLAALEEALATGDVACVLAEPIMTNCGMVLPDPGYHEGLRALTRQYGAFLVIDETHTLSSGYGGYTREHELDPDFLVFGKAIAGGIPIAGYGFTQDVAERHAATFDGLAPQIWGQIGVGGTLTANAFSIAVLEASLEHVATREAFDHMLGLGAAMARRLEAAVAAAGMPWTVTTAGARAEMQFLDHSPRTASEALAVFDWKLMEYTHLFLLNRGILITPFHNMMLVAPTTTEADVEILVAGWAECMGELASIGSGA